MEERFFSKGVALLIAVEVDRFQFLLAVSWDRYEYCKRRSMLVGRVLVLREREATARWVSYREITHS